MGGGFSFFNAEEAVVASGVDTDDKKTTAWGIIHHA
jgi:hypothetical protein